MYGPDDAKADALYSAILAALREAPDRLGKKMLSSIFEERGLCEAVAEKSGVSFPEGEEKQEALGELWERVEELRDLRAEEFLRAFNREEF